MDNATPDGENGGNGGKNDVKHHATFSELLDLLTNAYSKLHEQISKPQQQ
jgi:uncharacterized membrane-anchored protein YhcB (DUF1043 family)